MERIMARVFDETLRDFQHSWHTLNPYWLQQPVLNEVNIGNAVGSLVNDNERFAVEVDVKQFHPSDLSVNIRDRELVIEGHHEERSDPNGRIERHFIRKYTIPDDANPESIISHLSDNGVLSVTAKKTAVEGAKGRNIPIQAAPRTKPVETQKQNP